MTNRRINGAGEHSFDERFIGGAINHVVWSYAVMIVVSP